MTRFECDSGASYGVGPGTTFTLDGRDIRAAAVVLIIGPTGRYRWANPSRVGVSAFQTADYLEQIARHIHTDAKCIIEHAGKVQMNRELDEHLAASDRRGRMYWIGLGILVAVYMTAIWMSDWSIGVTITGAIVCSLIVLLAYRSRRWDHLETDRLIDGAAKRDLGGTDV